MVTNSARSPLAPDVPTADGGGLSRAHLQWRQRLLRLARHAGSLKARIAADVRAIASDPAVAERLKPTGATMRPGTAADFAAAIEEQRAKVAAVAQARGEAEVARRSR